MKARLLIVLTVLVFVLARSGPAIGNPELAEAEQFLRTGKYAEAREKFQALAEAFPVQAALGEARSLSATGQRDQATKVLADATAKHADAAILFAELALLAFERGDHETAGKSVAAALGVDKNQPAALWVKAELLRVHGQIDAAENVYQSLIERYNQQPTEDAETLYYVGLATAQFARWNRRSEEFSLLVNELFPDALSKDANYWPAHLACGKLYLEKYNEADATKELKAARVINPHAAEVYATLAALNVQGFELSQAQDAVRQALELNPQLLAAHLAQADIHLANFEPQKAVEVLRGALELNPVHEETLGRLAAALASLDGLKTGQLGKQADKIVAQVVERNPRAGEFYYAMAEAFEKLRRFPTAATYYREAGKVQPKLAHPAGQEGLMLMRLGQEDAARKLLADAFDADPFNVRVSNTLKVLEVLEGYETLETEHFIIRFDPKHDKLLATYAAAWLEEQYPVLCKQFGFEPPEKSLFEIFNRAKNTSGHGWFSARMVGLPHIHTIGACAGQMVAMQSPNEGEKFNWARVLKHEFIHVLNLQQTNFNIPHWFTEALATYNEGYPRPKAWNDLLSARLASEKLFNLETINWGFIRARNSAEWNLAYCQAELYAEFMLARFGEDSLAKMLSAYADNLDTPAAISRSFGISQQAFDAQYLEYLKQLVAALPSRGTEAELTPAEIAKKLQGEPENPQWMAAASKNWLDRKDYAQARRLADKALKLDPKNQLAAYVRARLYLLLGETAPAMELLTSTLDEAEPQSNLLGLLAGLRLKAEDYPEAARLYELGMKSDPADPKWAKALASVYLKADESEKLTHILARLAEQDADEFAIRKKLTQLAIDAKDFAAAERWAREAIQIDVNDAEVHRMLAQALQSNGKSAEAQQEENVASQLEDSAS